MIGWVKLHRALMEKAIWLESTPEQKTILITLLMMANHEGREWEWQGKQFKAKPGQFVTSLPSLVQKCGKGITVQNVRTALKRFEKYEFLTDQSTGTGRLITIVNWGFYQGVEQETNIPSNSHLTDDQQTPNRHLTSNKNDKNDKNDKKLNNDYNNAISKEDDVFNFYQNNFGVISSRTSEEILYWIGDMNEELVLEALKRTNDQKKQWNYAKAILSNWLKNNIKSIEDVYAADTEFQNRKSNRYGSTRRIVENKEDEELGW